jgi:hypothetical protein
MSYYWRVMFGAKKTHPKPTDILKQLPRATKYYLTIEVLHEIPKG